MGSKCPFSSPSHERENFPEYINCRVHVWWGMAGLLLPVDEQHTALPFPRSGIFISFQGSSWVSSNAPSWMPAPRAVLSTGEYLAHASHLIWALVPLPGASFFFFFFVKQAGKHNLLITQIILLLSWSGGPLSICSLPYFLWWWILIFLMKKQVFTHFGRLRILTLSFRGRIMALKTPLSGML